MLRTGCCPVPQTFFDIMEILVNRGSIGEGFQFSCTVALEWHP